MIFYLSGVGKSIYSDTTESLRLRKRISNYYKSSSVLHNKLPINTKIFQVLNLDFNNGKCYVLDARKRISKEGKKRNKGRKEKKRKKKRKKKKRKEKQKG